MITNINIFQILLESKDKIWYHGTDNNFDNFDNFDSKGPSALGIFVTDDYELAELFGNNVYNTKITYNNPFIITQNKWNDIRDKHAKDTNWFKSWKNELIKKNYDAIFIKKSSWTASSGHTFNDPNIVVVFDKSQIIKI